VDAVIKVGGSLAEHPEALKNLCSKLQGLAAKYVISVVPGGGKFADVVREFDEKFRLPPEVSHRLAILAMDQYGVVLSQLIPYSQNCDTLEDAQRISQEKKVPVLLPSKLMLKDAALEASWDLTSDAIAAYIALRLRAGKLVLITDEDGVFTEDPKKHPDAKLMPEVSVQELLDRDERTAVDKFLPKFLSENALDCYVVNGLHPERVEAILSGQRTVCTRIVKRAN
jgi:aspartokinase-like uncharacterized kinase